MEIIKRLTARFWPSGVLLIIGLILIIYIAIGFIYLQQGAKQREFEKQIVNLGAVVAKPLSSAEALQKEYKEVNDSLALKTNGIEITNSNAITMLVDIAEKSKIDVTEGSDKFIVSPGKFSQAKVGGGTYQLLSFNDIKVQGDYDNVMAFISNSSKTLQTMESENDERNVVMVLRKAVIHEVEITFTGEEGERRAEFRNVAEKVTAMMYDNAISAIPNPISSAGGVATNLMGDDPDTKDKTEGFPDITTTATDRGYSGNVTPRAGYVLYNHDKIDPADTTKFKAVSYISTLTTKYYYTCEANGAVTQFSGANVATATEYLERAASKVETFAIVSVDIYIKPGK